MQQHWATGDSQTVTLELGIGMNGISDESPYYNCGLSERLMAVWFEVPDQGLVVTNQLGRTLAVSNLSGSRYEPRLGERWYPYLLAFLMNFSLTTHPGNNEANFVFEFEIVMLDTSDNES